MICAALAEILPTFETLPPNVAVAAVVNDDSPETVPPKLALPTFVSRVEVPSTAAKLIVSPVSVVIVVGAETVSLSAKLMSEAVSPHAAPTVVSPLYVCAPEV